MAPGGSHQQYVFEVVALHWEVFTVNSHELAHSVFEEVASLLTDFPDHGLLDCFVALDFAAWDAPETLVGCLLPPDQQDVVASEDNCRYPLGDIPTHDNKISKWTSNSLRRKSVRGSPPRASKLPPSKCSSRT